MVSNNIGYYEINRKLLSIVGQWPYQNPKEQRFFFIFTIILVVNGILPQVAQFFICDDIECIFETVPPHLLAIMVVVKFFTLHFNKHKIKDLTDRLFINWNIFENEEERKIMEKYTETGKWFTIMYTSYIYTGTVAFSLTGFAPRIMDFIFSSNTSHPIMLPYPAYYFVNEERYFYYIFCHMLITAEIGLSGLIAHDCLLFVYIEHACGLFAVIGFRFQHVLYKRNNEKKMINHADDVYCKNIVFAIHAHRKALQFALLLENTFTLSFGIQILLVTIGMSISLVQFSIQLPINLAGAMKYLVFIGGQLFHLFCYSFEGQKLINHSSETSDKIYNSSWYEIPASAQRLLLMVMRKSIEVSALTAGKIYVFSLESFTTVMQTSMSYFTVLSSFNE